MQNLDPQTRLIRTQIPRGDEMEHSSPLFLTSSFCFDTAEAMRAAFAEESDDNIYSRFSNPNVQEFIDRMCILEGAEDGFATASGMSAIFATFMGLLRQGDQLLLCNAVFGSSHTIATKYLPQYGIQTAFLDINAPDTWEAAFQPTTKMLYLETPTNPGLELIDLAWVADLCRRKGVLLCVDNCFATPILQRPLDYGADLVIHSATKWIDGQGRVLGGIILGRKTLIRDLYLFCRNTGPSLSPFNAWVLSRSLETLALRMERHSASALVLAQRLENHKAVQWVKYPFLPSHPHYAIAQQQMRMGGGIVCFEIKGGASSGQRFMDALQLFTRTSNLGDVRSIVSHPSSTTHSKLSEADRLAVNITPGLIRLSIGLEHCDDLWRDLERGLDLVV